jgi:hypothetical protein
LSRSVRSARRDGISARVLSPELKPAASKAHIVEKTCWLASTLTPLTEESTLAWPCRFWRGTLQRKIAAILQAKNKSEYENFRIARLPEKLRFSALLRVSKLKMQNDSKWQPEWSQGNRKWVPGYYESPARRAETSLKVSELLAVNVDFAEAQQNTATCLRAPETCLRAEVGKHHHLVDLALHRLVVGTGENSV